MSNSTTVDGQSTLPIGKIIFQVDHKGEYGEFIYKNGSEVLLRLRRDDLSKQLSEERV